MKPTISKPFKSNDKTFDKVYNAFDKRDYFNSQGLAKVQIGNFERALKKNDKGAQQVLDMFKGDEKKAKDYITQVISDRNKERAFNNYKAMKSAVDSIQKGKPNVGAVDYVKRIIHNSSQKYSIALYSALRNKKFTKWKDVHNDVDDLIGEGFKSDAQRKAAFASGYEEKGKKKKESVNELSDKDIKKAEQIRKSMPGFVGPKFAKKASNEDILAFVDLQDKEAEIYNSKIKPIRDAKKKLYKKYRLTLKESVNEAYVVLYSPKKGVKPVTTAAYKDKKDAEKWAKDLGGVTMIVKKKVKGIDEGKKRYYQQDKVGSAKYTISYHDGKKKHKDGSDFFDIKTFKNKKDLAKFVNTLHKGGYVYGFNESVNEGISVFDERHFGKKGIIIMIDDNGKKVSAIFKDKKNADKFNRNNPSDIKKLLKLAKSKKFPQTIDESVNEDKNQIIQLKKKVNKNEIKFYDALDVVEKKLGKRKYRIFLEKSLKQFGINGNHYDYRTNAAAEEKLFQVAK